MAAGLAMGAAALAASGARDVGRTDTVREESVASAQRERRPVERVRLVSAPVRIADAATVRLLRRGDRVDVIAAATSPTSGGSSPDARVVAAGVRVTDVPQARDVTADGGGALIVLSVPRATAAALAGAGATSPLAVTLC